MLSWLLLGVAVLVAPPGWARPPAAERPTLAEPPTARWSLRGRIRTAPDRTLPLVLDLAAAALRSGRPLADAIVLAAPAAQPQMAKVLNRVASLSRLGADADQAWSGVPRDGPLSEVGRTAVRSAASGLKLAAGFERLASEIRAERATAAAIRAHRASVSAMAPLAACFLPSFVCLGVVPVVVGIARNTLGVVP
jgi:Flp pilus assembly protein TadB